MTNLNELREISSQLDRSLSGCSLSEIVDARNRVFAEKMRSFSVKKKKQVIFPLQINFGYKLA